MAFTDINFQEGEGQDFIVEIPLGLLNAPLDILAETDGNLFVLETPEVTGGGDEIFIMME